MISIIGAGPIGCYLAYLLAKNGKEVSIFEEHREIGKPVQCTGIITEDINRLIKLNKSIISNITTKIKIHSKNNDAELYSREIILKRDRFDKYLLNLALKEGAKLYKGYRYESFSNDTIYFENKKTFKTDILIGADGPNSKVAKTNSIWKKRAFYIGVQARTKIKSEQDTYQVFLGEDFPGFFGWIVPENSKIARIGIAAKNNPDLVFKDFIKRLNINEKDIIEKQGGLIPLYDPEQRIQNKNIFLIGDAAGAVKATTGGGLIPGLKSAKILANCIVNKKDYVKEFKNKLSLSLWSHLMLRKTLDKFNDKDYSILLKYVNQDKIRKILDKNTRENPFKLLLKLGIAEPRFLRFAAKLL